MKKFLTLFLAVLMICTLAVNVSADEEDYLKVEVKDGKLVFTATGDFSTSDWIGVYPADRSDDDYSNSLYWWYLEEEGRTYVLPDDAEELSLTSDERILTQVADADGKLRPGKFKAIILANGGYAPLDDMGPVYFEIKDYQEMMSRDQVTVDGADKAAVGNNGEITDISENLYPLVGKQIRFWGWYANDKALDKFGVRVDGGEMVYFDKYEDNAVVEHVKGLFNKDEVFASRFEILVDLTEGRHTAQIFAIVGENEIPVWSVNYRCLEVDPTEAPTAEPTAEPTAAPTDAPTAAPTGNPATDNAPASAAPASTDDAKQSSGENKKPNLVPVFVVIAAVAVIAVVAGIIIAKKKGSRK